jgi:octaprenyl-diphosphate synthase
VLDDADTRRKKPSAKQVWGNLAAVLGGDFIYSKAAAIVIEADRPKLYKRLNDTTLRMIEGQALELMHTHDWHMGKEEYMDIIAAKTAELMSAACAGGAIMADTDEEKEEKLAQFGLNLGIAFQLMDDILDYTASEETFGKPVGKDLKEGKITLPLIYSLADFDSSECDRFEELFKTQNPSNKEFEKLIHRVRNSGAIERIQAEAKGFADQAADCLEDFPDSSAKEDLKALNTYLVERDY